MVAGQSWVGDVLTQERHQQGGRVLLCRRPCREQLRAFTKSSQATASAAPHLNEGEEAQSGADTSHSDGSDSVNHAAPRNSARDSIQEVATRLDFGDGNGCSPTRARPETREVSTQTDERPQAREVSIQTEERRWHGVHMERARTVPEQPGYKRLLRSLRGEADALPPLKEADVLHEHEKPWT